MEITAKILNKVQGRLSRLARELRAQGDLQAAMQVDKQAARFSSLVGAYIMASPGSPKREALGKRLAAELATASSIAALV